MLTWIDKAKDIGLFVLVTSFFWGCAIHFAMMDYAIQHHAVMATHSAVVTHDIEHQRVEYTTNTGRHVEAALGNSLTINNVSLGETVKVKYVIDDPEQAYLAAYQPRYIGAGFMGGLFLVVAGAFGWTMRSEWDSRNANWAAEKLSAEAPLAPRPPPSRRTRRRARQKHASKPRNSGGNFVDSRRARRRQAALTEGVSVVSYVDDSATPRTPDAGGHGLANPAAYRMLAPAGDRT
jgi:hypothetical protein